MTTEDCLADEGWVINGDLCTGSFPCINNGGVILDRVCLEQCPDGTSNNGQGVCERPPLPECDWETEMLINGVCLRGSEIGYDDMIGECNESFPGWGGPGMQISIEASDCPLFIDQSCAFSVAEGDINELLFCLERPCLNGGQNVNGQCIIPSCAQGEVLYEGQCIQSPSCPDGAYQTRGGDNITCTPSCADGLVAVNTTNGGQCRLACPAGYTSDGGQCTAPCPLGEAPRADGQCRENPCTTLQTYAGGQCRDNCPSELGQVMNPEGMCIGGNSCAYIVDGFCVDTPPSFQDAVRLCLSGQYLSVANPSHGTCDTAVRDECSNAIQSGPVPAHCAFPIGDITRPGGQRPSGPDTPQPGTGEVSPPDTGTPPPDTGTPPPEGTQPPPVTVTTPSPPPGMSKPPISPLPGKAGKRTPVDPITRYKKRIAKRGPLAIVIANARYKSKVIKNSPHAVGGAKEFVKFLQNDMRLPANRIIQQSNMQRSNFVDLFGQKGGSAGRLKKILAANPASELIIYYSGRAMPVDGGSDAVLLTRDAIYKQPIRTAYRLSDLYRRLASLGVQRVRLYLDTAFSTPSNAQPGPNSPAFKPVKIGPSLGLVGKILTGNWVIISAGTGTQATYADPKAPRSAFTDALLSGLRGQADTTVKGNKNGAVTASELDAYLRNMLQAVVRKATGGTQRPSLFGSGSEILTLGMTPKSTPAPEATSLPQSGTVKPSFNCAKAYAKAEKAICGSPAIATLDNVMVGLYKKVRRARKGAARNALVAQQKSWLKQRNACGSDIACLAQRYGARIQQLQ